ncbi:hypothetical protein, partial [Rubrivirga sp.]|uniref:hypothetical protein n=1 Tax=Rubrivirga sp. TaxID=1885344 RepID=UPI003C75E189
MPATYQKRRHRVGLEGGADVTIYIVASSEGLCRSTVQRRIAHPIETAWSDHDTSHLEVSRSESLRFAH